MKPKTVFMEILWLAGIFIICWLGIVFAFYYVIDNGIVKAGLFHLQLEISLHDTYLVLSGPTVFVPFLIIVTIVYLIKEAFYLYTRRFQNIIILVVNALLIFQLVFLIRLGDLFAHKGGWTIYPPLSALPQTSPIDLDGPATAWYIFRGVILFFILTLMFASFITGKNWNKKPHA